MKFDHYEYRIGIYFAPALINGDYTGLSDDDAAQFNDWLETIDRRVTHWDMEDKQEDFTRCEVTGLHSDCIRARAYFPLEA
jgi:hypothetical protein